MKPVKYVPITHFYKKFDKIMKKIRLSTYTMVSVKITKTQNMKKKWSKTGETFYASLHDVSCNKVSEINNKQ